MGDREYLFALYNLIVKTRFDLIVSTSAIAATSAPGGWP